MYKYPMQLTQVVDHIRYVNHMEVFSATNPGLWQDLSCAGEQGAIILERTRVLRVIESLGGEAHLRNGT